MGYVFRRAQPPGAPFPGCSTLLMSSHLDAPRLLQVTLPRMLRARKAAAPPAAAPVKAAPRKAAPRKAFPALPLDVADLAPKQTPRRATARAKPASREASLRRAASPAAERDSCSAECLDSQASCSTACVAALLITPTRRDTAGTRSPAPSPAAADPAVLRSPGQLVFGCTAPRTRTAAAAPDRDAAAPAQDGALHWYVLRARVPEVAVKSLLRAGAVQAPETGTRMTLRSRSAPRAPAASVKPVRGARATQVNVSPTKKVRV